MGPEIRGGGTRFYVNVSNNSPRWCCSPPVEVVVEWNRLFFLRELSMFRFSTQLGLRVLEKMLTK